MKSADAKLLICAAVALATIGFFLIDPYLPSLGPLENATIGTIRIGMIELPYRYVLVFTTVVIGLAFYTLKEPSARKSLN